LVEDHISALLTKDKNKLKVYTDHYDGHCLRAYSYWKELMPDITEQLAKLDTTEQIYKVTYDDGSVKYLPESEIKELQK
jgi:DNA polymerase I